MTTRITFNYDGERYVLEYTRTSVEEMERRGFIASEVLEKPLTTLPDLFAGAFIANHPLVTRKTIDAIFSQFDKKDELLSELAEMYSLIIDAFVDELGSVHNGLQWERG